MANALALSGPITPARPMLCDPYWMNPHPFGVTYYDTQLDADLAQARKEVKFFAKQARTTIESIRVVRRLFAKGLYAHVAMVEVDAMFDGLAEDLRFYLGRRRTWLSCQLVLENQRLAQAHDVAAE